MEASVIEREKYANFKENRYVFSIFSTQID